MESIMPRLGQGTWRMGETPAKWRAEIAALQTGMENGMCLIDTAEMYGNGKAESLVGEAIRGFPRDTLYIVSKVFPYNASGKRLIQSCEASLKRLGIECLSLYLLHWRGEAPLEETVEGMERLVAAGKIRRWGVSNFDVDDMEALFRIPKGANCATNQILYHLGSRGVEHSLLPWLQNHGIPAMAYCPLAQAGALRSGLLSSNAVGNVAKAEGLTPFQVLLGFVLSHPGITAIPKASTPAHVRENAAMAHQMLTPDSLRRLSEAFPAPTKKVPLDIE